MSSTKANRIILSQLLGYYTEEAVSLFTLTGKSQRIFLLNYFTT
jgi:hypothetical protein